MCANIKEYSLTAGALLDLYQCQDVRRAANVSSSVRRIRIARCIFAIRDYVVTTANASRSAVYLTKIALENGLHAKKDTATFVEKSVAQKMKCAVLGKDLMYS